jgi:hypothetical protein
METTTAVEAPPTPWFFPRRRATAVFTVGFAVAVEVARFGNPLGASIDRVRTLTWFEAHRTELALLLVVGIPVVAAVVAGGRLAWLRGVGSVALVAGTPVLVYLGSSDSGDENEWSGLFTLLMVLGTTILAYPFALCLATRSWSLLVPVVPFIVGVASFFALRAGFTGFVLTVGIAHALCQRPPPVPAAA